MRPKEVFNPNVPVKLAGIRIDDAGVRRERFQFDRAGRRAVGDPQLLIGIGRAGVEDVLTVMQRE